MIAKLSKGGSFGGAVQYIFGPGKGADCLAGMGVLFKDTPPSSADSNGRLRKTPGSRNPWDTLFSPFRLGMPPG